MTTIDAFKELYERQVRYQATLDGSYEDNEPLTNDRIVLDAISNCIEELVEARMEIGSRKTWNPEKRGVPMNIHSRIQCGVELVDTLHFLMNAFIYLGFNYDQISEMILLKMRLNDSRPDHLKVAHEEV